MAAHSYLVLLPRRHDSCSKISGHLCLQQCDERWVHECIVVWNIQTDQAFALERRSVSGLYFRAMRLFHDEDDVGPFDQFGGQGVLGVVVRAGGRDFDVWPG